ncbi:MAG TPA: DAK2 domain-containing protein [Patescibacteria group bacterium]|nr:DAK2 domain-containing protein [Patescibacteria group bacterium]
MTTQNRKRERISGGDFRRMIAGSYRAFLREHEYINSLNVYPVPDGDTGTNMLLTLGAVARAVEEAPRDGIGSLSKRAADSAIMGARGNSGVIFSQMFRGIARGLAGKDEATSAEIGKAFQYGILYAYRAVSRPVEGTILSVARGIAKGAHRAVREQRPFDEILIEAVRAGREDLKRTPELLPVLKAAGVVDAGGQGLITFLSGCLEGLAGVYTGPEADFEKMLAPVLSPAEAAELPDITHPYCTEFLVNDASAAFAEIRRKLDDLGDSVVVAEGGSFVKVHIHTAHPGAVLETAINWGTLHGIKIENMADQHRNLTFRNRERASVALISVVSGEGLIGIMRQMGADIILSGGQTMNPPVEDFMAAVHGGHADRYIILPNNKNIILAANQVKKLLGDRVTVIPTTNIPQGLAAILAFNAEASLEENLRRMTAQAERVKAGAITIAVRDSQVRGETVPAGRFIGVADHEVLTAGAELQPVLQDLARQLAGEDSEMVSLYYGLDLTEAAANAVANQLRQALPQLEVELYFGGQPQYHFLISVE